MEYYELTATKTGSKIVERFFEDGRRFLKYVPFNPKVVTTLKEQFKDKPIDIELKGSWIVITKRGKIDQFEKAGKELIKSEEELTVERIAQEEKKMLQRAGYSVLYVVGKVGA